MDFVTEIYLLTNDYPKEEMFGLISQTRRAATSIPFNIAEGSAKSSDKDFARFLEMAIGSSMELETALIVAFNLKYIDLQKLAEKQSKITELQKMIYKFKTNLN
ncbi:conserved hypothetical protein [uncultured Paludibacter sp.]|uniref:S23 ribosomal protein n=1 Tax=uncultured Paludibacter sp. TaxID=497635 RepID=A0A653AE40_9BACT|nr:conserved hypothetical protein [uncultured Paludibacter sp.]